jgi:hypothetical protein
MTDLLTNPKKVRLKSSEIRAAMAKRWCDPQWSIMWEVGEGTGARSGRYADAVMMSLWPSRGLELHGVEIKVSRSDWKREAADPSKAEAIARYCDRWWIHTGPGVVDDLSDLPPAWGLREFDGKSWSTIREAEKTDAEPVTRHFLASMLRRADGAMRVLMDEAMQEARAAQYAEIEKQRQTFGDKVDRAVAQRTERLQTERENVAEFERVFGAGSARDWSINYANLGAAAKALAKCGPDGFGKLTDRLRAAADEIDAIAGLCQASKPERRTTDREDG